MRYAALLISLLGFPVCVFAQSSSGDDNTVLFLLVILAIVIYVVYKILWLIFWKNKCPYCKKRHALRVVDTEFLGTTKTKKEKQPDGSYATIHYNKVKIIKKCKYCGATVNVVREERGK